MNISQNGNGHARERYADQPGEKPGRLARTYRLDRQAVQLLDQMADELRVGQSELLQLCLLDGLKRIISGELRVVSEPIKYRLRVKP